MKKVNIYKLNNDAEQVISLICIFHDNEITFEGSATKLAEKMKEEGIIDYSSRFHTKLFPSDGIKFLDQLKNNFKTPYLAATDIIES